MGSLIARAEAPGVSSCHDPTVNVYTARMPDELAALMADEETTDPGRDFARLMSGAGAAAAPAVDPEAPYGWTVDRDGNRRPKKTAGRPRKSPAATPPVTPATGSAPAAAGAQSAEPAAAEGHDPDPAWVQDDKPAGRKRRQSIEDVPRETVDDMAGLAGLVGAPILAILQQADPYCGTVLAQNYEPIVDAVLPLLCRSKKITDYFAGDQSDWLLWGKLAMALAPVGRAFLEHHVFRSVQVVRDEKTGAIQVVRGQPGRPEHGDHLVPPGPGYQYAA